ncbi:fimbrial protein [Salmonella enterica]|uniref:Long polar fimbrial protein LpfA n=1 Tax=Salmonella enterica subsp. enterica serovar Newport str. CFSAN000835 TaxID=1299174 RepID=A0A658IE34_SALNE|nr:fimbrial protein [Salmonella enterica]EAV3188087.1 long polar fimbrial protein LpfA [Salmonella enterica subsp. enterica]EAW1322349.1 long polar fimbrial protein LpfA [Salmonella enterica subsp. diarizonae]ECT9718223.1 long polar fimbrial protein LpfA [Salmonella enterica subsp. diarizonae str. CFSAN000553]EGE4753911.1 fimbrial protein [Salmonella enterica subsp. diarizonae serovar 38:[k]:z35]SUG59123.1 fimbrial protein [Salmonella enterica subsp. arizonae]HAF0278166.1 fimbrial protein [Sa
MRNKITLAMAIVGMMSTVPAFAAPVATTDAGQGTIQFTGSVIDAPCSIVPSDQNIKVNLGQVSLKTLDAANKYSSAVPVTINLTGCSFEAPTNTSDPVKYSKVAVTFPDAHAPAGGDATKGEIANDAPDAAENVVIQLLKSDASTGVDLTKLNPTTGDIQLDTTSATSKLQFYARMMTLTGAAKAGSVGATVTYKLHYF